MPWDEGKQGRFYLSVFAETDLRGWGSLQYILQHTDTGVFSPHPQSILSCQDGKKFAARFHTTVKL